MSPTRAASWRRAWLGAACAVVLLAIAPPSLVDGAQLRLADQKSFESYQKLQGDVIAFGDINGDKYTDLFILQDSKTRLGIHLWNEKTKLFAKDPVVVINAPTDTTIVGVSPGDFTGNGKLDVLLTLAPKAGPDNSFQLTLHEGDGNVTFATPKAPIATLHGGEPTFLDYQSRMQVDIMGLNNSSATALSLWRRNPQSSDPAAYQGPFDVDAAMCVPAHPHSNSFVDLNGDCQPDLFLTCKDSKYEIWQAAGPGSWRKARSGSLPSGTGFISFGDIDGDGTLDAIFPVCSSGLFHNSCSLKVVYNKQISLCNSTQVEQCRSLGNMCAAYDDYRLDFDNAQNVPLSDLVEGGKFKDIKRIRLGDYNLDGYPDLLFVASGELYLLQSVPCTDQACQAQPSGDPRTFEVVKHGIPPIPQLQDAVWFDIDENGSLDLMAKYLNPDGKLASELFANKFDTDAFFIKMLTSGSTCTYGCQANGISALGSSFKLTIIDPKGVKKAIQVSQTYQTSYQALQMPYAFSGLGRTNNYIEELSIGVSRNVSGKKTFTGIIPNSQLVAYALPDSWKLELFINPHKYAFNVFLVLVVSLLVLGATTGILHWLEKKDDEREKIYWI